MFIKIKKYKIVFRMRKDHLRIIFFLMTIQDLMQGLETNNYESPREKNISSSCPKHPKINILNKKWQIFISIHFLVVPLKNFIFLRFQKRSVKTKNLSFPPLCQIGTTKFRLCYCTISVSLTIETHKNNIGISRVTDKQ